MQESREHFESTPLWINVAAIEFRHYLLLKFLFQVKCTENFARVEHPKLSQRFDKNFASCFRTELQFLFWDVFEILFFGFCLYASKNSYNSYMFFEKYAGMYQMFVVPTIAIFWVYFTLSIL